MPKPFYQTWHDIPIQEIDPGLGYAVTWKDAPAGVAWHETIRVNGEWYDVIFDGVKYSREVYSMERVS